MKKTEMIKVIAKEMGITQAEAGRKIKEVDTIIEAVVAELEVGAKTKVGDYISVEKKVVPARVCRNPKTGEEIKVEERVAIKIKATTAVKSL